jgi:DNA-binding NtrC family response regulator
MKGKKPSAPSLLLISQDRDLQRQLRACVLATGLPATALVTEKTDFACATILGKIRPRLIIIDDAMSALDGVALLHNLRQQIPDVHVIYLTTRHTVELERTVRQLGVLYYTEKPPDSSLLGRLLASALAPLFPVEQRQNCPASSPASVK